MRKIIATEYMTLDGVFEEPGRWSHPFFNDEAAKFKYEELFASGALLMGRVTFEGFASAWPTMQGTGDFGERMNNIQKYVVSKTLKDGSAWNNSTVINGNVVEALTKLKQQESGGDLLLSGSARLLNSLLPHGLIDEVRLMLHPLVLGKGKRLFEEGADKNVMKLADTKKFSAGIVVLTYHPEPAQAKG